MARPPRTSASPSHSPAAGAGPVHALSPLGNGLCAGNESGSICMHMCFVKDLLILVHSRSVLNLIGLIYAWDGSWSCVTVYRPRDFGTRFLVARASVVHANALRGNHAPGPYLTSFLSHSHAGPTNLDPIDQVSPPRPAMALDCPALARKRRRPIRPGDGRCDNSGTGDNRTAGVPFSTDFPGPPSPSFLDKILILTFEVASVCSFYPRPIY